MSVKDRIGEIEERLTRKNENQRKNKLEKKKEVVGGKMMKFEPADTLLHITDGDKKIDSKKYKTMSILEFWARKGETEKKPKKGPFFQKGPL